MRISSQFSLSRYDMRLHQREAFSFSLVVNPVRAIGFGATTCCSTYIFSTKKGSVSHLWINSNSSPNFEFVESIFRNRSRGSTSCSYSFLA